jgi:hypothetical protein
VIVEGFGGCLPAEGFAGAAVEGGGDGVEVAAGVLGQVGAFGEVLAEQAVDAESKIGRSAGRRQYPAERQRSRVVWA